MSEPPESDPLSREVIIAAKLEENGITLRAKSRAVAALDRLIGSLCDIPAAFAEGVSRKKRLKDEINERLRRAQADIAERRLRGMDNAGDALLLDVLEEKARKQINAASVAVDALDALKALPPPTEEAGAAAPENEEAERIDEDWMNQFVRFAEDASSDDLRQLWGRVLAGEIRKRGSFSRHTLRFIAELDSKTAQNCEFAAQRLIADFIPKSDEWNSGEALMVGLDLQRLGLLEGVGFGPRKHTTIEASGFGGILGRNWALLLEGEVGKQIGWDAMLLTRMGEEVFSLLEVPEVEALRALAEALPKDGLKKIQLGTCTPGPNGNFSVGGREVLWEASPPV
ncbi:MAG: DUF2806 domain-containing protein [Pseudomonadota bacterium]